MMWRQIQARLRSLWRWRRQESELDEEIRFHLARETEERIAAGMSPEEARAAARRDFGNVTLMRELTREAWGWASAEALLQDARGALRAMRRNPAFSAVAAGTLALAVGVNVVMFSVLNTVLFRPLPYRFPHELVMLWTETPSQDLRERPVGVLERRGVAALEPQLPGPGGLRQRGVDADARGRDAAGPRGQGLAQPVSAARHRAAAREKLLGRRGGGAAASRPRQPSLLAGPVRRLARRARARRSSSTGGRPPSSASCPTGSGSGASTPTSSSRTRCFPTGRPAASSAGGIRGSWWAGCVRASPSARRRRRWARSPAGSTPRCRRPTGTGACGSFR